MYICVGKTTTAHNLGMVLGQRKRVLLIDLDAWVLSARGVRQQNAIGPHTHGILQRYPTFGNPDVR